MVSLEKQHESAYIMSWCIILTAWLIVFSSVIGRIEPQYSDEQIVNAIWIVEGGSKASYAYGIRSVNYESIEEARAICLRTVRNNRARWAQEGKPGGFLPYLARKYCPMEAINDSRGLNKHWLANLKSVLKGGSNGEGLLLRPEKKNEHPLRGN